VEQAIERYSAFLRRTRRRQYMVSAKACPAMPVAAGKNP